MLSVIVELKANYIGANNLESIEKKLQVKASSFKIDINYPLIKMQPTDNKSQSFLIRGEIDAIDLNKLKSSDEVEDVFEDSTIAPFG